MIHHPLKGFPKNVFNNKSRVVTYHIFQRQWPSTLQLAAVVAPCIYPCLPKCVVSREVQGLNPKNGHGMPS